MWICSLGSGAVVSEASFALWPCDTALLVGSYMEVIFIFELVSSWVMLS